MPCCLIHVQVVLFTAIGKTQRVSQWNSSILITAERSASGANKSPVEDNFRDPPGQLMMLRTA